MEDWDRILFQKDKKGDEIVASFCLLRGTMHKPW
jgi:hypothetical protein